MTNTAWPRTPEAPWYDNYIVLLSAAAVVASGLLCMMIARPCLRADVAHGDAVSPVGHE